MADQTVYELVRKRENDFILGNVKTSKYVFENFYEDVSTIEAYLNSKHISGSEDSLGREKPFFNIVLAARNIWFRATDLDRKNIRASVKKAKDYIAHFIFTAHLQKWMRDENFGQYLNDWGLYLASYNSAVTKFIENSEGLHIQVIPWQRLIVDILGFEKNPKIEILEMTQDELRSHPEYDQEIVEKLIQAQVTRKTIDRQTKDTNSNYVRLYEVHGELPLSWLTGKEKDENTYVQQMHVVSFVAGKNDGKWNDYTLVSGREKKDPYYLTQLIPAVDGSISLMGAVKTLFEAQWMTNHTVKNIKDQLDLASKTIYQTADPNFANQNVLNNIETGQIMIWDRNIPNGQITQINNEAADIGALESYLNQWKELTQTVSNTPNALTGQASSTQSAYAKEALLVQQATANFDIMTQNKGLALEEMFIKHITPYILKQLNNADEITAELGDYGVDQIDKRYISNEAAKRFNQKAVDAVLNETALPDLQQETQDVTKEVSDMGNIRFIKPSDINSVEWSDYFKDFEADVEYIITDENIDKNSILQGLNGLLATIMSPNGQMAIRTPEGKLVFNEILNQLGVISPVQIQEEQPQMQPGQPMQQPQQVGGGQQINQPIQ
jgi:hypothetical protein